MAYKWYTRARKFPQLIGRTPDGTRIPGGPYTVTQVLGGIGACFVTSQILKVWSPGDIVSSAVVLLLISGGVVFLLRKLPPGMRNPLVYLKGVLRLFFARGCRFSGKSLPDVKASRVAADAVIVEKVTETLSRGLTVKPSNATNATEKPARTQMEVARRQAAASLPVQMSEQVASSSSPALTGVQRLLLKKENKS